MNLRLACAAVVGCALHTLSAHATTAAPSAVPLRSGALPMAFEANQGQTDARIRFLASGDGYAVFFKPDESVLYLESGRDAQGRATSAFRSTTLRTRVIGGNAAPEVNGENALPGQANYLVGAQSKWTTGIAQYAKVRYTGVYPGIDLVYYGNQQRLEYDFVVAPGADPSRIALAFSGADGLSIDAAGELRIRTAIGDLVQHKPIVYQTIGGRRVERTARYVLHDDRVGFEVAAYDRAHELVIDPILSYTSYVPGVQRRLANSIAADADGNTYVSGYVVAGGALGNIIDSVPVVRQIVPNDVFVTKIAAAGGVIRWTTFFGGSEAETGIGLAVDAQGNSYITGHTLSNDLPVVNAVQPTRAAFYDLFIAKLNPKGNGLLWSTYFGGVDNDYASGIAVDPTGNVFVSGQTFSHDFTTVNAHQGQRMGTSDAVLVALGPAGNQVLYSTYLGGTSNDTGTAVAADANGNAVLVGQTDSADFPTTGNSFQPTKTPDTCAPDPYNPNIIRCTTHNEVFVAKFAIDGSRVYSSYLGGSSNEFAAGAAMDAAGNAYVTGRTGSSNFPTKNPIQGTYGGAVDAFLTKVGPLGGSLVYSTYLGGTNSDEGVDVDLDASGNAYVAGHTYSRDYPTYLPLQRFNASQGTYWADAFVTKLNPSGQARLWSTYFGAYGTETLSDLSVDSSGNVYIVGATTSRNLPVKRPVQSSSYGESVSFLTKIAGSGQSLVYSTYFGYTEVALNVGLFGDSNAPPGSIGGSAQIPTYGLVGCVLRAVDGGVIANIQLLYPTTTECGELSSPP